MNRFVPLLCSSMLVVAAHAAAQTRPDFAGRWTSVPDSVAPAAAPARGEGAGPGRGAGRGGRRGDMGSGWGPTITITQDASRLTVEYVFFGRGELQPPLRFVYALDGAESKNTVMMGWGIQEQRSRASWQGDKLAITTVHAFPHPETGRPMSNEVTRVLSLESPTSLVVEVTRAGVLGGSASTTRTVYRKL